MCSCAVSSHTVCEISFLLTLAGTIVATANECHSCPSLVRLRASELRAIHTLGRVSARQPACYPPVLGSRLLESPLQLTLGAYRTQQRITERRLVSKK